MNRSGFRAYPHLTEEEFGEICHYLDRRYSRATLGATRKEWRLSVHTSLNVAHGAGFDFITYLQITCPLAQNIIDDDLSAEMDRFTLNNGQEEDIAIVAMETSDQEVLCKVPEGTQGEKGHVCYEVHLHPVYRAPCLWFSLHDLPAGEPPFDIDTVFRRLVPDAFKNSLRGLGSVGGISADVGACSSPI